jgi:hypothetical protein
MPDEQPTPTTEAPAAEQAPRPATPPAEQPKPEPKPEPDWREAYVGLQRTVNKLHSRNDDLSRQNAEIADALRTVKETQTAIARQSLGEDQVAAIEAAQRSQSERAAALSAARSAEAFVNASIVVLSNTMASAGVPEAEVKQALLGAKQSANVQEWAETVNELAVAAIAKARAAEARKAEDGLRAKTQRELKEEAEALAQQKLKEAGVDKIDTASGNTSTSSLAERIAKMDPSSDEFKAFYNDVLAGRVNRKK